MKQQISELRSRGRFDLALVTDLKDGSQIKPSRRVILTAIQAIFPENMTQAQWSQNLLALKGIEQRVKIYQADGLRFGKRKFGDAAIEEIVVQLEMELEDMEEIAMLAQIPPELRHEKLTARHYIVAGYLLTGGQITAETAATWMRVAVEEQLTPDQLKESILAGHVIKSSAALIGSGSNRFAFLPIHSIGTSFIRWEKQMELRGFPWERIPIDAKRQIFAELKPIGEAYLRLKQELEAVQ
jgi:hypothetical protein